jgi:hypothetical protein
VPVAVPADVLERMALGSALAPEPLDFGERFGELVLSLLARPPFLLARPPFLLARPLRLVASTFGLFERLSLLLAMGVALRRGALSDGKLRGEALHDARPLGVGHSIPHALRWSPRIVGINEVGGYVDGHEERIAAGRADAKGPRRFRDTFVLA